MTITIPEEIANELGPATEEVERRVLEAVALEGYRSGRFSIGFVGRMLGLSLWEAEEFLDRRGARHPYSEGMLHEGAADQPFCVARTLTPVQFAGRLFNQYIANASNADTSMPTRTATLRKRRCLRWKARPPMPGRR